MPLYDYKCSTENCTYVKEMLVSSKLGGVKETCPLCECKSVFIRLPVQQGSTFHLKGSGWGKDGYSNDH